MESTRILGIDPGSRITGYGVIDKRGSDINFVACGAIKTTPKLPFPYRLQEIHTGLTDVIEKYIPQMAAVEDIFFARNPKSALKLGQARGAIIITILQRHIGISEYSAKQVKQAVAGYGQASKAQVQHMVRVMLNLTSTPSEDASDALAVAICLANHTSQIR